MGLIKKYRDEAKKVETVVEPVKPVVEVKIEAETKEDQPKTLTKKTKKEE